MGTCFIRRPTGQTAVMTVDRNDRRTDADASAEMESKLKRLDEHIEKAAKKSRHRRALGDPPDGDALDDLAGGGTDHDERLDDPETSALIDSE